MKKKILKAIYSVGGFRPFHFLNRREVLVLMYHRFSVDKQTNTVSRDEFEEHLQYLKQHAHVLPLGDIVSMLESGLKIPPNTLAITIDDGYADAFDVAFPLLTKYKMPATLYAITDFVDGKIWLWTDLMRFALLNTASKHISISFGESGAINAAIDGADSRLKIASKINEILKTLPDEGKVPTINEIAGELKVTLPDTPTAEYSALTWDQASEMDRGCIAIESHTVTHPILTKIGGKRLQVELEKSKAVLSEKLQRDVEHFCYPNGALDENVVSAVARAGYKSAVTTEYGFCGYESDLFRLRRVDAQPSIENFAQSVSGFEQLREKIGI